MGAKLIGGWVAVVLALLAFAGGAAGADGSAGGAVTLALHGTHGYRILVMAGQRPGQAQGRAVILMDGANSHVSYAAPATVTPTSLEADFGVVGRIALQLEPTGVRQTDRDCDGKPVEYEGGNWVGEVDLRGEDGFTTVSATSLPFSLKPTLRLLCGMSIVNLHTGGDGAVLHIGVRGPPRLSLSARTNGPGRAVEVIATIRERHGEVTVSRTVERRFPSSVFTYARDLSTAKLQPPVPFSGRGVFHHDAAPADRWTGDLRVDFPGRAGVPVTGVGLSAVMRRGEWHAGPTRERLDHASMSRSRLSVWPSTKR